MSEGTLFVFTLYLLGFGFFGLFLLVRRRGTRVGERFVYFYLAGIFLYSIGSLFQLVHDPHNYAPAIGVSAALAFCGANVGLVLVEFLGLEPVAPQHLYESATAKAIVNVIFGISLAITAWFALFAIRGGGTIASALGIGTIEVGQLTQFRKDVAYGGAGVFSPGYIKQFRDVLLPICIVSIALRPSRRVRVWLAIPIVVGAVAMLLSGQRMGLIVFAAFLGVATLKSRLAGRTKTILLLTMAAGTMAMLAGLTLALGRVGQGSNFTETSRRVVGVLADRIFVGPPRENMIAMPALEHVDTRWGQQLISDLSILLPGRAQSLSSSLHEELYGSRAGNSVFGLPADLYVNWGFLGVLLGSAIFAVLLELMDVRLARQTTPFARATRLLVLVSLPFMYSPYLFLLYGGIVAMIVAMWPSSLAYRQASTVAAPKWMLPNAD